MNKNYVKDRLANTYFGSDWSNDHITNEYLTRSSPKYVSCCNCKKVSIPYEETADEYGEAICLECLIEKVEENLDLIKECDLCSDEIKKLEREIEGKSQLIDMILKVQGVKAGVR